MPALEPATLSEISADAQAKPVPGTELALQFNPASLKLQLANKVEGGDTKGRQTRQYLGKTSTTLTFEVHFDTADDGTTAAPVSVRTKTAMIERFVLPKGKGNTKQAPPKARFHWQELVFDGIIDDLNIDFDLFASNGTPLRAKMTVSMKEQDAKYQLLESGPGVARGGNAQPVGGGGNGPGTSGGGPQNATALALGGESAAELAARVGVDPGAWRGLAAGLDSTLSIGAGASVDFSAGLSLNAGVGVSVGVEAGVSTSLEASFGLSGGASLSAGAAIGGDASAGFALSAAGGVSAAIETVATIKAETAAADTRRAFSTPAPASPPLVATPGAGQARGLASLSAGVASAARTVAGTSATGSSASAVSGAALPVGKSVNPAAPGQSRTPLSIGGMPTQAQQAAAPPAPSPPLADTRATTFGFGVPLRPRIGGAAEVRSGSVSGHVPLHPRQRASDVLVSLDPTAPPWTRLQVDTTRPKADRAQRNQNPSRRCGCSGPCRHGSA